MKHSFNDLKARDILTSKQMMNIKGGGTCCALGPMVNGAQSIYRNLTKEEALYWYADGVDGARWCCDSCSETWYCG